MAEFEVDNIGRFTNPDCETIYEGKRGYFKVLLGKDEKGWHAFTNYLSPIATGSGNPGTYGKAYKTRSEAVQMSCFHMMDYKASMKIIESIGKDAVRAVWTAAHYKQMTIFDIIGDEEDK